MEGVICLLALPSLAPSYSLTVRNWNGQVYHVSKETYKVLFSEAVVKIYISSEECLTEYWKPVKGFRLWIQKRSRESEGWLD